MTNPVQGINTCVAFKKESPAGQKISVAGGSFLDLVSEESDYKPVHFIGDSIIGNRQQQAILEIVSHHDARASFNFRMRAAYTEEVLAAIFGDLNTGVHSPQLLNTEDLESATFEILKAGTNELILIGCKVNTATFKSSANQPLTCQLDILGLSGERDTGNLTGADYTGWATQQMFLHGDMTLDATAHAWLGGASGPEVKEIEFTLNNNLDDGEGSFTNSTVRKILPVGMFELTGQIVIPYNATSKAMVASIVAAEKVKWGISYSDGTAQLDFDFVTKFEGNVPNISGPENVWLTLPFHGVVDTTDTLVVTAEYTAGA